MKLRTAATTRLLIFGALAGWAAHLAVIYLLAPLAGVEMGMLASFVGAPVGDGTAGIWSGRALLLLGAVALAFPFVWWDRQLDLAPWEAGVTYGLAVWLVSGLVIFPVLELLYMAVAPAAIPDPGLLGVALAGTAGVLISAAGHALWGLVLALVVYGFSRAGEPAGLDAG